jgi:hypothetical protein
MVTILRPHSYTHPPLNDPNTTTSHNYRSHHTLYTTDKNPSPSPNHIPHDLKHVLLKIHNIHVDTYPIQSTMLDYNINYSKELQLAPPKTHTCTVGYQSKCRFQNRSEKTFKSANFESLPRAQKLVFSHESFTKALSLS